MSLKVKFVQYDDVQLSTYHDIDVFAEELRVLLASGYAVTVTTTANSTLLPDYGAYKPPCSNRRKFETDHTAFNIYGSSSSTTKNDSNTS